MNNKEIQKYKLVVLGCTSVGKSAITIQYCSNHFIEEWDPTIEDNYQKQFSEDEKIQLDILDTAGFDSDVEVHSCDSAFGLGQEGGHSLRESYMKFGQGFLLIYDTTQKDSFAEMPRFYESVLRAKDSEHVPVVLCGNKIDRVAEREVSLQEGQSLAKKWNAPFFETSAREKINIDQSFQRLVKDIQTMEMNRKKMKKTKKDCILM